MRRKQRLPQPPKTGRDVKPRWWRRILSFLQLVIILVALGILAAAGVGFFIVMIGFLLERV